MALQLKLSRTQNEITTNLLARLPEGTFYLSAPTVLPNHYFRVPFTLQVDTLPSNVKLTVVYKTSDKPTSLETTILRPSSEMSTIYIQLYQGLNRVHVKSVDGIVDMLIACTNYGTWVHAIGEEIYDFSWVPYINLYNDIMNPFGSRIIEHLLPYQDMLPRVNSLRNIGARLCVKSSITEPGLPTAPETFLTGLLSNTPEVVSALENERSLRPSLVYLRREAEAFGGYDFHVWMPNTCATLWVVATKFWDRTSVHSFKKVSETEVVVSEGENDSQHRFPDPLGEGCSSFDVDDCIAMHTFGWLNRTFFAIGAFGRPFPFDTVIEPCYALGRSTFDCGLIFDNGVLFDSIDDFDPTGDGWVGFPLSRRLDGPHCLDTCIPDMTEITECNAYFPVTPLMNHAFDTDIAMEVASFGEVVCVGGGCPF